MTGKHLTVTVNDAPREDLKGPVTFQHPSIYQSLAIGRRATELANLGAPVDAPRYAVSELPFQQQEMVYMVATLEQVIHTAPAGFYRTNEAGHPELDLGQFDEMDAERGDSLLWVLYAAYLTWRSDFRQQRKHAAQ